MELYRQPYRWLMLALLWLLYFSFGLITRSPSPLITPIILDLKLSYGQMGLVLGSWQMTYIALAVVAGIIMDRWGVRKSIFAGAIVIGLSALLRSLSVGFITLLVFVAIFGAGGPMISIGCPKTISQWFAGKERATAVGIYTTGPWIGGMTSLAATNTVVMPMVGHSWRLTFVFYAAVTFLFAFLWLFAAKEVEAARVPERLNPMRVIVDLFRIHRGRIILLSGLLSFAIMHGYFAWLPKILEQSGMSPKAAGVASAVPFLASIPAVLTIPRMVPSRLRGRIIGMMAVLTSLTILWVVLWKLPYVAGLLFFGATGPCLMPLLILALMETPEVASKYLGSATGAFFCVAEIGGFLGPFVVGYLVDSTESFLASALFLSGLGMLILVCMWFFKGS
ncbi:MAG: MFS transporter [Deltaproteobacteria bacterium]|nr:MFS transporter [Deltaproteobacteria bacterium]